MCLKYVGRMCYYRHILNMGRTVILGIMEAPLYIIDNPVLGLADTVVYQ